MTAAPAGLGNFQILQEVSGELGKLFLARSKGGALVTIRELGGDLEPEQSSRLGKEVSLGARLSSDAVLQTKSLVLEERRAALVSEFLPGVSLQRLLRFATGRGVRLPDICALAILERVLAALASAHAVKDAAGNPAPVLHRMLLASSVVVGWDGSVKTGEFGLQRMLKIAAERSGLDLASRDHQLLAPEVAKGLPEDTRSDVYNAGLLAVRLLTGRTPFARERADGNSALLEAMAGGRVAPLAKTRPDLPAELRDAIDAALEPDRDRRVQPAEDVLAAVRAAVDPAAGKAALAKLLGRWRQPLETTVTPWEARGSLVDDVPEEETGLVKEGALTLATRDERASLPPIVHGFADRGSLPKEEAALAPTDPVTSLSRLGSIAPEILVMPLPAMRITMPSLPTYGGPAVNIPRPVPPQKVFSGKVAAAVVATMFVVLVAGTVILFRFLLHR